MCGNILCVVVACLGIDTGWQPLPEGGFRYMIQIEPEMLDSLRAGEVIQSDVPPEVRDIREYRIWVGNDQVSHELPPLKKSPIPEAAPTRADGVTSPPPEESTPRTSLPIEEAPPEEPGPQNAVEEQPQPREDSPSGILPKELLMRPGISTPTEPDFSGQWPPPPSGVRPELESLAMPGPLPGDLGEKPLVEPVAALETSGNVVGSVASTELMGDPQDNDRQAEEEPKPWMLLMFTLLLLFASIGGNVFLIWIAADLRHRYRRLLAQPPV